MPPSPRSSAFVCYRVATISKSAAEADYRFLGMKKFSEISSRNSKIDNILPAFWKKFSKNYKPGRPILISGRLLVALHPCCRHDSFFHDMCFHQNYSCITFCHGFHFFFCAPTLLAAVLWMLQGCPMGCRHDSFFFTCFFHQNKTYYHFGKSFFFFPLHLLTYICSFLIMMLLLLSLPKNCYFCW